MDVSTAYENFVTQPNKPNARRLLASVASTPNFSRTTDWITRADELSRAERWDDLSRWITDLMPGVLMTPAAHAMLAQAYEGIYKTDESQRERFYASVAIQAIEESGSGTEADPWHVLHVADEYAFLRHLGLQPVGQEALGTPDNIVDVIECDDSSVRWFTLV